jgi:lysozyme
MINAAGISLIKNFEGCKLKAYQDSAGVWTIGWGTTGRAGLGIEPAEGMTITQEEADYWLEKGVNKFADEIAPLITAPINANEMAAFTSLAYNIGTTNFAKSSALRHFNAGNKMAAAESMQLWNMAGGKVLNGLVRRRSAEVTLFLTPVPPEPAPQRANISQSKTVQASAVQIVSAGTAGIGAFAALDGTAQIVAMVIAGVIGLAALFIIRERVKAWASGWR